MIIQEQRLNCRMFLMATLWLAGCAQPEGNTPSVTEYARAAVPDDPHLAEIYQRSCHTCHGDPKAGAPLTGNSELWTALMDKGLTTLTNNVVSGIGDMPPYGLCMDCSATELRELIRFMARAPE